MANITENKLNPLSSDEKNLFTALDIVRHHAGWLMEAQANVATMAIVNIVILITMRRKKENPNAMADSPSDGMRSSPAKAITPSIDSKAHVIAFHLRRLPE